MPPLPARPSPGCETGHTGGICEHPLSRLFSGIFVCCNCVPTYAKGNTWDIYPHNLVKSRSDGCAVVYIDAVDTK